jgi:hypothetical protein
MKEGLCRRKVGTSTIIVIGAEVIIMDLNYQQSNV